MIHSVIRIKEKLTINMVKKVLRTVVEAAVAWMIFSACSWAVAEVVAKLLKRKI
jgi:hypothetical protein